MELLWILLGSCTSRAGSTSALRRSARGHHWLLWIGFFIPILRIVGAFIAPTERAAARMATGGCSPLHIG
jgi:hypothetical protein